MLLSHSLSARDLSRACRGQSVHLKHDRSASCSKAPQRMSEPMELPQRRHGWLRHAWLYWFPPLLWMAVMFGLSTDTFATEQTGGVLWYVLQELAPRVTYDQYTLLHFLIRKAAHLTEYAILACLLLRAFRAGDRPLPRLCLRQDGERYRS